MLVAVASATSAGAAGTVTICGRDDAPGGLNLRDALIGGGEIVLRCPDAQPVIRITQTHPIVAGTAIDGDGRVVLEGDGSLPFFEGQGWMVLRNLTVRNAPSGGPPINATDTRSAIVRGAEATIVLEKVRTEATPTPYVVAALEASDSVFEGNGFAAVHPFRGVIDANEVVLRRSLFQRNLAHPIVGGPPAAGPGAVPSRTVRIEDGTFVENAAPLVIHDAEVVIRRSAFTGNGAPLAAGQLSWGCCAGALQLVRADATISDTTFAGNGSWGFGGAVQAVGSRLVMTRVTFADNTARAGGALAFWGWPIREDLWDGDALPGPLWLSLQRVTFRDNEAQSHGGALLWSGDADGDAVLFAANVAGGRGGAVAHWQAAALPAPFGRAVDGLAEVTLQAPDRLALARGTFIDNRAGDDGAAVAGGEGSVRLGNALVVRNRVVATNAAGAAVAGQDLALAHATIADNDTAGLTAPGGAGTLTLANAILRGNARGNCRGAVNRIELGASNLQSPDASCGPAMRVADPGLRIDYALAAGSVARDLGDTDVCAGDPLVRGIDLRGQPRLQQGACSLGAVEADLRDPVSASLLASDGGQRPPWLFWLLLLIFLFGIVCGHLWRRRRRLQIFRDAPEVIVPGPAGITDAPPA